MRKSSCFDTLKYLRILQKEFHHSNEAKKILEGFPDIQLSNSYKKEINKYWAHFGVKVSGKWHQIFLGCTGIEDVRFIDNGLYYSRIIGRLNDHRMCYAYEDKNNYDKLFNNRVQLPKVIVRNISDKLLDENYKHINYDEAIKKLQQVEICIVKPALDSGGGKGIVVLHNNNKKEYLANIKKSLQRKDIIIQHYIQQNDALACYNSSSVNTIRVFSLSWKNEIIIIAKYLRVGNNNLDFVGCRTSQMEIKDDGTVGRMLDTQRKFHDENSYKELIRTEMIPGYVKIIKIIKNEHKRLNYFGLIGWDFSVDKAGEPILIEINTRWPALDSPQMFVGPAFGDLTDEIMEYVFDKKAGKLAGVYLNI